MNKIILILISVVCIITPAIAGESGYVGVKECKVCHEGPEKGEVYEKWLKSSHVKSTERLALRERAKDPTCLKCHTTGFNEGGYQLDAANATDFTGIQCESCHGPGAKHIEIVTNQDSPTDYGLVKPTEELCRTCHSIEDSPGFTYKRYWKKINHVYRTSKT